MKIFIGLTNFKHIFLWKKDKLVRKGDKNGQFTMKAYCNLLEGAFPLKALLKILWNPYVQSKVGFLLGKRGEVRF